MIDLSNIFDIYFRPDIKSVNCPFCEKKGKSPDTGHNLFLYGGSNSYFCFRCYSTGKLTDLLSEEARNLFKFFSKKRRRLQDE